ncbi:MAG: hypothetical protein K9M10_03120 [Candidatus Pacebacteria bacterium]|nr:hypothetical protein [Candidatus Paceibacterota bacterium]MCF7857445.1 hypothetical protein [Candidatus Paceibacterota bacterium]
MGNVTEKVVHLKETIDNYREKRNADHSAASVPEEKEVLLGTYTDSATITRTKIETNNNFLSAFISGVASLLRSVYTFFLWIFSQALSHPALIELVLLFGILYTFYRVARSLGRRPGK